MQLGGSNSNYRREGVESTQAQYLLFTGYFDTFIDNSIEIFFIHKCAICKFYFDAKKLNSFSISYKGNMIEGELHTRKWNQSLDFRELE